jgi:hypothetical protein
MEDVRTSEVRVKILFANAASVAVAAITLRRAGVVVLVLLGAFLSDVLLLSGVAIVVNLFFLYMLGLIFLLVALLFLLVRGLRFLGVTLLLSGGVLLLVLFLILVFAGLLLLLLWMFFGFPFLVLFLLSGLIFFLFRFLSECQTAPQQDSHCGTDCEFHFSSLRMLIKKV